MFKFVKSLWWFISKNWYRYVSIVIVGLFLTVLNLVPAWIVSQLTDAIEKKELTVNFLFLHILVPFLITIILIYVVQTTKRVLQNRLKVHLYYALQVRYMENILVQDATFFEHFQSGDLLTRALGDVKSVNFSGGNRLLNIFLEAMTVAVTLVAMILIRWDLALLCFIPLSLIFVSNLLLKAKVKRNWQMVREKSSQMGNVILESITNVRTIRAFSKEEENYQKNLKYSQATYDVEKANLKINVIFQPMFQSIVAVATIIAYGLGGYYCIKYYNDPIQPFTVANLVLFTLYLNQFQGPLTNIGNMINNFYQSLISADRLNEIYDAKSSVVDKDDEVLNKIKSIEFRDFSFRYEGDNDDVLKHIDLTITEGQTLGIVGKTGSGKSTLVRQLVRQLPIDNEKIFINGEEIEVYNQQEVRRHVGYVPQEHMLFSRSVLKNVLIGDSNASLEEVNEAVMLADFEKDIEMLAEGFDTVVGEYGVTLSGGQKQRLAIARAFLKDADVLIMDDSLSAVDGKTESNIIHSLKKYRSNKTNIIVAHRLSAVMHANQIIVLDEGHIVERGTHEELMALKGWYYEQFMAQQMEEGDDNA
ncbi:MAG: ABC transporter ATP-binding protein/permease [Anaeroplasmataceae bacterium]|nr:ABC transporter ATP-binding protein/permease [Anaeroplasmataceae bacterium]